MISNQLSSVRNRFSIFCAAGVLLVELTAATAGAYARGTTQFEAIPLPRSRQNHLLLRAFINGKAAWPTAHNRAPGRAISLNRRGAFLLKPSTHDANLPARAQINS